MTVSTDACTLGDYSVVKQIGQGSLGAVLLAEHRFIKKQYVLKVLPEELASDRNFVQRFEKEIQCFASLDHPHIAKIHNISHAQGKYFLVTDCVVDEMGETTNLAQYIKGRGSHLDEETLTLILKQVASALDYAHHLQSEEHALVHGGLKLNNVLIGKGSGGQLHTVLTDFGLSSIVGVHAVLTRTFQAVAEAYGLGSLSTDSYSGGPIDMEQLSPLHASFLQNFSFLAPEQKKLEQETKLYPRTDSWAFGILTYFLIAGKYPEGCFLMPSELGTGYTRDWDRVVKSCLHPDSEQRPLSLEELLQETAERPKSASIPTPVQTESSHSDSTARTVPVDEGLRPVIRGSELETPSYDPDPLASLQVDSTVKEYRPEPKKNPTKIQPLQTEMVVVPGGHFLRGSRGGNRDEEPEHKVNVTSFAMDVHPVTNEQFIRFLEALSGFKDYNNRDIMHMKESRIKSSAGKWSIESGYSKHPVVGVTWYGAVAYAKWVGKRLPTEAEWEIAAKSATDECLYPTGNNLERSQANYFNSDSTPVMSYAPNNLGLYDVAGNVYEWCQDWYKYDYYKESTQNPYRPTGPIQGVYRVLRGGCWKSLKEDLRCSHRHRNNPGTGNRTYGFRCAADVEGI